MTQRICIHDEGHYLMTEEGRPFFWLGDTAWQLIHDISTEEARYYLNTRRRQGYNVIQTVVLSEFDGLTRPSATGLLPFEGADPTRINDAYFDHIESIIDEAGKLGLYVALVASWGDKLTAPWGTGPRIFTNDNLPVAFEFAAYLGRRFGKKK